MEFTGSTQGTPMPESGVMGEAMVSEFKLALTVAVISGSSSAVSNTALAVTISGEFLNSDKNLFFLKFFFFFPLFALLGFFFFLLFFLFEFQT